MTPAARPAAITADALGENGALAIANVGEVPAVENQSCPDGDCSKLNGNLNVLKSKGALLSGTNSSGVAIGPSDTSISAPESSTTA